MEMRGNVKEADTAKMTVPVESYKILESPDNVASQVSSKSKTLSNIAMTALLVLFLRYAVVGWAANIIRFDGSSHSSAKDRCSTKGLSYPTLPGAQILSLTTESVANLSLFLPQSDSHFPTAVTGLSFCSVTIVYTHPGYNDTITTTVWLPSNNWNGRFMGTGGGGYVTGGLPSNANSLAYAVSQGYSAVTTDGGHIQDGLDPSAWALSSKGNVNWALLQDFTAISLNDATILGKAVTEAYYGKYPKYSYWNGCSTGGRQGQMLAQRYAGAYDGIIASAPAMNWDNFVPALHYPQLLMHKLNYFPPACELEAITSAAILACDVNDGLKDGIITNLDTCTLDAASLVGTEFDCNVDGATFKRKISAQAVKIANATWQGPYSTTGEHWWYGLGHSASISSGTAATTCDETAENCKGAPFIIGETWLKYFVAANPDLDVYNISFEEYDRLSRKSINSFKSIIGTADPDLTDFKLSGGKMITWHGLADPLIPPNGTFDYFDRVKALDGDVIDYFRVFPAPGIGHCVGGVGYYPANLLAQMVDWVEHDNAPDTLVARTIPDASGKTRSAPLCLYPKSSHFVGGNPDLATSFECV